VLQLQLQLLIETKKKKSKERKSPYEPPKSFKTKNMLVFISFITQCFITQCSNCLVINPNHFNFQILQQDIYLKEIVHGEQSMTDSSIDQMGSQLPQTHDPKTSITYTAIAMDMLRSHSHKRRLFTMCFNRSRSGPLMFSGFDSDSVVKNL